jgi:hypothetical protein
MGSAGAWCSAASPDATRHNAIPEEAHVTDMTISLAVWDVPMPVVAGERFAIKAGAKATGGGTLSGTRIEVIDEAGAAVASGTLGDAPLAGTEALYWTALDMAAPAKLSVAEYTVRLAADGAAATRFSVAVAAMPVHTLAVTVTERDSKAALDSVEIRLGAFHARTGKDGRAELRVAPGAYELQLWRTAHIAPVAPLDVKNDVTIELTMLHVPEDHPDARWVR